MRRMKDRREGGQLGDGRQAGRTGRGWNVNVMGTLLLSMAALTWPAAAGAPP